MDGIGSAAGPYGPQVPDRIQVDRPERAGQSDRADRSRQSNGADPSQIARQEPTPAGPTADAVVDDAVAMPDGVDPELWSLLTTEERAHFARFAAMGGVTYGPESSTKRPFVQGQRLDLRI